MWFWIFGSFFQDPKIRSVWPSSVVRWSDRRPSIAVDIPRGRRERVPRGRSYFSCFARRTIFYGTWVRGSNPVPCNAIFFQGRGSIPGPFYMFTGPWDPWPMSLAPTIGGSVWLVEKIKPPWGKNYLAMAWGKNKPPWGKKFLKSPSSMQKPGCTGEKASWCVTSCYTYKIVCINHKRKCLWRGRLMLLLCLTCDMHKWQFLYFAPKSWWWLSSAWDPDCPIVWMLW
jgi:hypothetical protein